MNVSGTLRWHAEHPDGWTKTWQRINEKYHLNPAYRRFSCSGPEDEFNIDAKISGAAIVMGLLYGQGDPDQTIIISTRCGQDSGQSIECRRHPVHHYRVQEPAGEVSRSRGTHGAKFSHTPYNFPTLIRVCETWPATL